jgi:hypothetical protein
MPRLADGPAGRRPVNMEEPAYEEIGHLDPDGQGGGRYVLEAGRVTPLSARVVRVVHDSGLNSFLIGGTEGWALINRVPGDAPHEAALRAAAPGPVRWVLPADSGPQALDLGGATLHALGSQRFLLAEEGMLFTDDATTHAPATDQIVEWIVPSRGFMRRPVSAAAD